MNTGFAKMEDKYGDLSMELADTVVPAADDHEPQESSRGWKDSEPVVMLSAFLKEYGDQGFSIHQTREGYPLLHFNPGLKSQHHDPARWDLGQHAMDLMDQARSDLIDLIANGAIKLEEVPVLCQ